jgi:hypothetical protein
MATRVWAPGEFINPGDLRQPRTAAPVVTSQLTNYGFETGNLTGWTVENAAITVVAGPAFEGTYSLRHPDGLLGVYGIRNTNVVPVQPGQQIKLGCRYRRETDVRGRQTMKIVIEWLDASQALISISEFEQRGGQENVWYDPAVTGVAPANAAFARAAIYSFQTGDGGSHHQYFDNVTWDYVQPVAQAGLVYKAVQANAGFTGSTEPAWPILLGQTVVDNEVTWEAVLASDVTWRATPICLSGSTEPTWPVEVGATVLDGTIAWKAVSRRIEDVNCPNSKAVAIAASKIFAADKDIIRYCATVNPLDWTTRDDAGYLPFGLQTYGSNDVATLGLYRSNLVAFNSQGFQMWQVDQDPANMAFLDAVPIGSTYTHAWQPVANDLVGLTAMGVRNVSIAGASTNLQADGVGEPIDPLVKAAIKQLTADDEVISLFWPARGQYWVVFGNEAFVLTINGAKKKSWSRYVFPADITDATLDGNTLVLRSGTKVWDMSEDALQDDMYSVGDPVVLSGVAALGNNDLLWTAYNPEGTSPAVSYLLERSINGSPYTVIATIPAADPREYQDAVDVPGTYSYRVRIINEVGDYNGYSNVVALSTSDFGNNVLLLQYNTGVQVESTECPHVDQIIANPGAPNPGGISTAQHKFGTASYHNRNEAVDNTNYVQCWDETTLNRFVFSGPFTMEGWFYRVSDGGGRLSTLFANNKTPGAGYFFLGPYWNNNSQGATPNALVFQYNTSGEVVLPDLTMGYGGWIHIAITRDDNDVVRVFLDGVPSATQPVIPGQFGGTVEESPNPLATYFTICEGVPFVSADFDGYFDQIRVTRNVCRYTTAFTPPDAPFPTE